MPRKDDHEAGDDEDALVGGLGRDVADEDVVDEVGGGGEEVVVGGGNDFGEDGSDHDGAEDVRQAVHAGVGEDLAGAVVDLAGGEEGGAEDGDGNDDGLENDDADEPADDGAGGVLLRIWRRRTSGTWIGCRA